MKSYDVVIVGGGPAGLGAALAFGRGRASALLVDGGTPRNARAHEMHNFVTRDGTPPAQFRALARSELAAYPSIELRDGLVSRIVPLNASSESLAFEVVVAKDGAQESVRARRVLLATGMRDELPEIAGLSDLWGTSIFQCPYCHGWEVRDRPWGVLVTSEEMAAFAPILTGWASHVIAFTNGAPISDEAKEKLRLDGVTVEVEPIASLRSTGTLEGVELASGRLVPCAALVMRPAQRPVELVLSLELDRDEHGFVRTDPFTKESSRRGIHVVGDTTTMRQAAIMAAADGTGAAAAINHGLIAERLRDLRERAPRDSQGLAQARAR